MLETILAYATKRFEATDDGEVVRERHYHYFLALAERHRTDQALLGADATEHLARLDAEAENLKAALGWAVDRHDRGRAMAAVGRYWWMRDRRAARIGATDHAPGPVGGSPLSRGPGRGGSVITDGPTAYVSGSDGLPIEQIAPDPTVRYFHHDQLGSADQRGDTASS